MRKPIALIVLALFALLALPAVAQDRTLTVATTKTKPTVDGSVASGEYGAPLVVGTTSIAVVRTVDVLSIAVSAQTQGWVAVGIGSGRMDGATIFIGFVKDGKLELKTQLGRGHAHGDTTSDVLVASAGKEENGRTTIELALKPSVFIAKGQKELTVIVAYGSADSFTSIHAGRWSGIVKLAD